VKITPAHDFNDFEVGKRHDLPLINIFTIEAKLALKEQRRLHEVGAGGADLDEVLALDGQDRFKARKAIIEMLEARELMVKIEPNVHMVPHGDRSNVVIEPYLTDQWYVDAKTMAQEPLKCGARRPHEFRSEELGEDLFRLAREHPAVVHLAPALVGPPDSCVVWTGRQSLRCAERRRSEGRGEGSITARTNADRDEDVLDTWFSSALWPFSTLGWPDRPRSSSASTRRPCLSPVSTSSSSGSPA
jgi:valyl-tRNA synthetase